MLPRLPALALFFISSVNSPTSAQSWDRHSLRSEHLTEPLEYYVALPAGYQQTPSQRYPVVYWLHGLGGSATSAVPVVERLDASLILVSPSDPTRRSMWTDSKDGAMPIETILVRELVPHIDETYRTFASRESRAIGGFSMGGYGAAYLGFKYPEVFGTVSILAGALHTPESLEANRREIFDAVHSGDQSYAAEHSPWTVVAANAKRIRGRTNVRLHVGADDALVERNERYHALLEELGIVHEWSIVPNTPHDLAVLLQNWNGNPVAFYTHALAVR